MHLLPSAPPTWLSRIRLPNSDSFKRRSNASKVLAGWIRDLWISFSAAVFVSKDNLWRFWNETPEEKGQRLSSNIYIVEEELDKKSIINMSCEGKKSRNPHFHTLWDEMT